MSSNRCLRELLSLVHRGDIVEIIKRYPHANAYGNDKKPKLGEDYTPNVRDYESLDWPSYGRVLQRMEVRSIQGQVGLRVYPTQAWHGIYQPENVDDYFLLGKDNNWQLTPKVRTSLFAFGDRPCITDRPEDNYPPARTQLHIYFLDSAQGKLRSEQPTGSSTTTYKADKWGRPGAHFTYTLDRYTEIQGPSNAKLFMSTQDHDDMDAFIIIRKLDVDGNVLVSLNVPMKLQEPGTKLEDVAELCLLKHLGANGRIRASKRAVPTELYLPLDKVENVAPGTVVELDIPTWPTGVLFEAEESLRVEVSGYIHDLYEEIDLAKRVKDWNKGSRTIHTCPGYPSHIALPVLPEVYRTRLQARE